MTQKKASVRELALQIHASQSEHSENLKRLIKEFGFPDSDLGADGAHAAFLIVQHSLDKPFRSEFCSLQKMLLTVACLVSLILLLLN